MRWLRIGAVGLGLGAAVTAGQGVAAATPDDSTSVSNTSSASDAGERSPETPKSATDGISEKDDADGAGFAADEEGDDPRVRDDYADPTVDDLDPTADDPDPATDDDDPAADDDDPAAHDALANDNDTTMLIADDAQGSEAPIDESSGQVPNDEPPTSLDDSSSRSRGTTWKPADSDVVDDTNSVRTATSISDTDAAPAESSADLLETAPVSASFVAPVLSQRAVPEVSSMRMVVETPAPQSPVLSAVTAVVSWLGLVGPDHAPVLPALPLGGLAQSMWLVAGQAQNTQRNQQTFTSPSLAGLAGGDAGDNLDIVDTKGRAVSVSAPLAVLMAAAVDANQEEIAREAASAQFNMSLGWIPVVGTVYNALNLAIDLMEFSTAVLNGDTADMIDEIGDMAVDVVGLIPIVGGPLAAGLHYLLADITPVNQPPNAVADSYTMNEDTQLKGNVLTNDTDPEGDPLTAALDTSPAHGTVTLAADGTFTYTPAANFYGSDTFKYTVSDGQGVSVGVVNITVKDVAEPPPPSPYTRPVTGYRITQEYGGRHTGIDLAVAAGTPVVAAADGVIYFEGWGTDGSNGARSNWMGSSAGISILVQHDARGIMTGYAHLSRTIVDQGQRVSKGQVIGYVGCTGSCTGPHLHFEVLPMPLNSRNGISGRVNPRNYMSL